MSLLSLGRRCLINDPVVEVADVCVEARVVVVCAAVAASEYADQSTRVLAHYQRVPEVCLDIQIRTRGVPDSHSAEYQIPDDIRCGSQP